MEVALFNRHEKIRAGGKHQKAEESTYPVRLQQSSSSNEKKARDQRPLLDPSVSHSTGPHRLVRPCAPCCSTLWPGAAQQQHASRRKGTRPCFFFLVRTTEPMHYFFFLSFFALNFGSVRELVSGVFFFCIFVALVLLACFRCCATSAALPL